MSETQEQLGYRGGTYVEGEDTGVEKVQTGGHLIVWFGIQSSQHYLRMQNISPLLGMDS